MTDALEDARAATDALAHDLEYQHSDVLRSARRAVVASRALIADLELLTAPEEHDCEFGCPSGLAHLQRAYDELKAEYAGFRRSMRGGR